MKKLLIVATIFVSVLVATKQNQIENLTIPDTAIRLRVIPNSNSAEDLNIKQQVKEYLEQNVYNLLENTTSVEDARTIITANLPTINSNIEKILQENNYDQDFTVSFGDNYFPDKEYRNVNYESGYYESLVVYIGKSQGDNWWCVLFPPLCLLEAEENQTTDVEYSSLVKEMIDKLF